MVPVSITNGSRASGLGDWIEVVGKGRGDNRAMILSCAPVSLHSTKPQVSCSCLHQNGVAWSGQENSGHQLEAKHQ